MDYAEPAAGEDRGGTARVVEHDAALLARLVTANYKARAQRAIVITLTAWDANCPQHIPRRFEELDVDAALAERERRIAELEREVAALRRRESA